jgi:hypothetical protein
VSDQELSSSFTMGTRQPLGRSGVSQISVSMRLAWHVQSLTPLKERRDDKPHRSRATGVHPSIVPPHD